MPAAAVIPAPIAYIKVVAVKKLVVGFLVWCIWPVSVSGVYCLTASAILLDDTVCPSLSGQWYPGSFTLKKLECLKQAFA